MFGQRTLRLRMVGKYDGLNIWFSIFSAFSKHTCSTGGPFLASRDVKQTRSDYILRKLQSVTTRPTHNGLLCIFLMSMTPSSHTGVVSLGLYHKESDLLSVEWATGRLLSLKF